MTDPRRLRDQRDLPDSLRDALRSLEQSAPSAETVARVQRTLQALQAPAAATAFGLGWGAAVFGTAVATLAVTSWVFLSAERTPTKPLQLDPAPAAPSVTATPAAAPATPTAPPHEQPQAAASPVQPGPPRVAPAARSTRRAPARGSRPEVVTSPGPSLHSRDPEPQSLAGATPNATAHSEAAPEVQAADVVPAEAQRTEPEASAQTQPVAPPPLPEPEDEASLLYRAKRLARSDPAAALRMIDSHALHFPSGAFVEEREVLAIELHERLGHDAEAKRRAARFLARFPHSVYRNAVTR